MTGLDPDRPPAGGWLQVLLVGGPLDVMSHLTVPSWFHAGREDLRLTGQVYRPSGKFAATGHAIFEWVEPSQRSPHL
jgi:hypothetical protein